MDFRIKKYTQEDRDRLVKIKRLFDQAHIFQESGDVTGFANSLADLELEYAKIYPEAAIKYNIVRSAELTRRQKKMVELDYKKRFLTNIITLVDERMRESFAAEMQGHPMKD